MVLNLKNHICPVFKVLKEATVLSRKALRNRSETLELWKAFRKLLRKLHLTLTALL